mgnify:FL=1
MATCACTEGADPNDYVACRALQGASDGCESLEHFGKKRANVCRIAVLTDLLLYQIWRDGDAPTACRKLMEVEGVRGPSLEKGCAALIRGVRGIDVAASCVVLKREFPFDSQEQCEPLLKAWSGEISACKGGNKDYLRSCRAQAALVAGLRDPARCAASPSCQALIAKSPGACDGLREQVSRALCAGVAKNLAAEQQRLAQEIRKEDIRKAEMRQEEMRQAEIRSRKELQKKIADEAAARAAAAAKIAKEKPQFRKGEPMETTDPHVLERIKAIEEGRPIPIPKPEPKMGTEKAPDEE